MKKPRKVRATVALDPHVVSYVAELADKTDRSRSWVTNQIIIEYRRLTSEKSQPLQVDSRLIPSIQA